MGAKEPPHIEGLTQRDEEATVDVFEVSGSIKWFDASKGYGFIVPDEDHLPDILLHVTCLRRDGFQTAYEGARVVCEVLRRPKGLQAFRIRAMDDSTAVHPSQLPQRTHVAVTPESDWESAMVKWFNRLRGFGFLTRGPQTLLVRYGRGPKGLMAAELKPDSMTGPSSH
jgi:CspA family cold shock protein